ncbi:MAG: 4-(cytidine 5'-diphospho)-2-C-methyl-D-erythritol kinase [Actinomycetota bacterium]|nr:4-(cytidine 5'-diphospho)-2-C-methyl-D-erythritol kinase [Actinomycetota bacterium]
MSNKRVRMKARGKINPLLKVLGKRLDGFHELESVMMSIDLCDEVELMLGSGDVEIAWADGLHGQLPKSPDLVARAIQAFSAATELDLTYSARVTKRIPIGAGLGGGSADAAAALVGMNDLADTPLNNDDLRSLAMGLGSDVSFMIEGGTALVTGRGDELHRISQGPQLHFVIGLPPFPLSTADVYAKHDETFLAGHPDADFVAILSRGKVAEIATGLRNDLEPAAALIEPDMTRLIQAMRTSGALESVMCGSGSAIAGLCLNRYHAEEVAASAMLSFARVEIVRTMPQGVTVDS